MKYNLRINYSASECILYTYKYVGYRVPRPIHKNNRYIVIQYILGAFGIHGISSTSQYTMLNPDASLILT